MENKLRFYLSKFIRIKREKIMSVARIFLLVAGLALYGSSVVADTLGTVAEQRPAPEFSAVDTDGVSHSLSDYRDTVLVINFWATWCPPCIKEMPSLQRAWQALKNDGVQVLAINMGETLDEIAAFSQQTKVDFPLLLDENMAQGPLWQLKGLPTTYIVDGDGVIVYTVIGEREWDDPAIVEQIRDLAGS